MTLQAVTPCPVEIDMPPTDGTCHMHLATLAKEEVQKTALVYQLPW